MKQYKELLQHVLDYGVEKEDRTGTGTLSVFGHQTRYDLSEGFPLLTTKKIHLKSVIHELLWFLSGDTNTEYLTENGVRIWNEWCPFVGDFPSDRQKGIVKKREVVGESTYIGNYSTAGLGVKRDSNDDKLRNVWVKMMKRCYDSTAHNYHMYGERGVTVHKDWHDPSTFIKEVKELPNWGNKLNNWNDFQLDKDYYGAEVYGKESSVWLHTKENNLYTRATKPFKLVVGENTYTCMSYKDAEEQSGIPSTTLHRWKDKNPGDGVKFEEIKLKDNEVFRYLFTNGNLGRVYGKQWREWQRPDGTHVDQIAQLVHSLKTDPNSRRHIVSAWNPGELDQMALPPCHAFFQFYVSNGKLSCQLYQRSADIFLGIPFNIASYSLLTLMLAQVCGYEPGEFIHTLGDAHIYKNHLDQVKLQLTRDERPLPTMKLNTEVTDIFSFKYEDFTIEDYNPHPTIKGKVAI